SAASVIAEHTNFSGSSRDITCPNPTIFGHPPNSYPITAFVHAYHTDVVGEWITLPATGSLDTVYWYMAGNIGAEDSTVLMHAHTSVIGPDFGPGVRPGPYPPPCQTWGYWNNTNDVDMGTAPFIEYATDTNWISTIQSVGTPTRPPFADVLWGFTGFPVKLHPGINQVFYNSNFGGGHLGPQAGDRIFISWKLKTPGAEPVNEQPTDFPVTAFRTTPDNADDYPSHVWKFFEHDSGDCGAAYGTPKRGWVAIGGLTGDSLDIVHLMVW